MKTVIALALLSSIAATPALAESFTRDGETYDYAVKETGSYKLITGRNLSTGQEFTLRVHNGRVSGNYAGQSVSFPATKKVEVASR